MKMMLCGRPGKCCPTVDTNDSQTFEGNVTTTVSIRDDYGGKVAFTKEQWEILKDKIKSGELQ